MSATDDGMMEGGREERPLVEVKKVCPLLSLGLASGVGKNRALPCIGTECAWWNERAASCTVLAGPGV